MDVIVLTVEVVKDDVIRRNLTAFHRQPDAVKDVIAVCLDDDLRASRRGGARVSRAIALWPCG